MLKLVGGQQQINKARSTIGCVYVCDRDQISDDDDDDDDVVLYCTYYLGNSTTIPQVLTYYYTIMGMSHV